MGACLSGPAELAERPAADSGEKRRVQPEATPSRLFLALDWVGRSGLDRGKRQMILVLRI